MELINKIRKSRKGFTLVEIIVVLVILAVLAAFTIPSMIGFVKDARDKAHLAEAREVYIAAQAATTETVAKQTTIAADLATALLDDSTTAIEGDAIMKKYLNTDIPASATWTVSVEAVGSGATAPDINATGKITQITYTPSGGKTITIKSDGSAVTIV